MADVYSLLESCQDVADLTFQPLLDMARDLQAARLSNVVGNSQLSILPRGISTVEGLVKGAGLFTEGEAEEDFWTRVVGAMSTKEFCELTLDMRLRILFWCCDEALSTHCLKSALETALEARAKSDRESKLRFEGLPETDDPPEPSASAFSRSGRRISSGVVEAQPIVPRPKTSGRKRKSGTDADVRESSESDGLDICRGRHEPIGRDRAGSLYWVFFEDSEELRPRLLCQRLTGKCSEWLTYSSAKDVAALCEWLSDKCRNEAMLKAFVQSWASANLLDGPLGEAGLIQSPPPAPAEPLNLTEELAAFTRRLRSSRDSGELESPIALLVSLPVKDRDPGAADYVVKERDGTVYISSVSSNSALRVGDIVVAIENHYVTSVEIIHDKIADLSGKRSLSKHVTLLVLRHRNPLACPYFRELVFADEELAEYFYRQESLEAPSTDEAFFNEQPRLPSGLLGCILHLYLSLNNSYSMTHRWLKGNGVRPEAVRVFGHLKAISELKSINKAGYAELHRSTVESMTAILINISEGLEERGTVLSPQWSDQTLRLRSKWRLNCRRALTYSHVSMSLATLRMHIEWRYLTSLFEPIIRTRWLELVDPSLRPQGLPVSNEMLLYYGEGHQSYSEVDLPYWGETLSGVDAVIPCRVTDVECYAAGPAGLAPKCHPFMVVAVDPSGVSLATDAYPNRLNPSPDNLAMLSRLLDRILYILIRMPDMEPFLNPVSKTSFPDYISIVDSPLCLRDMEAKIGNYSSVASFKEDVELIRSNCHKYCADKFPDMIALADRLLHTVDRLIADFREELETAELLAKREEMCDGSVNNGANLLEVENDSRPIVDNGEIRTAMSAEENRSSLLPPGSTFCVRLLAGPPLFLVKRFKYDSAQETLARLELETKFRMRTVVDGTTIIRYVRFALISFPFVL